MLSFLKASIHPNFDHGQFNLGSSSDQSGLMSSLRSQIQPELVAWEGKCNFRGMEAPEPIFGALQLIYWAFD